MQMKFEKTVEIMAAKFTSQLLITCLITVLSRKGESREDCNDEIYSSKMYGTFTSSQLTSKNETIILATINFITQQTS